MVPPLRPSNDLFSLPLLIKWARGGVLSLRPYTEHILMCGVREQKGRPL